MKLAGPVGFVGRLSPRTHDLRLRRFGGLWSSAAPSRL